MKERFTLYQFLALNYNIFEKNIIADHEVIGNNKMIEWMNEWERKQMSEWMNEWTNKPPPPMLSNLSASPPGEISLSLPRVFMAMMPTIWGLSNFQTGWSEGSWRQLATAKGSIHRWQRRRCAIIWKNKNYCNPNFNSRTKLHKIGFSPNDLCSFCEAQSETLSHIFYQCSLSRQFWTNFESYFFYQIKGCPVCLSLENVLYRIIM